jgi:hypothetical protein
MTDFLDDLGPAKKPAKMKRPSERVAVHRDDANRAGGGKAGTQGNYKYLSTRIPVERYDEVMVRIKNLAQHLGVPQNDIQLAALLFGIGDMENGEVPEIAPAEHRNRIQF